MSRPFSYLLHFYRLTVYNPTIFYLGAESCSANSGQPSFTSTKEPKKNNITIFTKVSILPLTAQLQSNFFFRKQEMKVLPGKNGVGSLLTCLNQPIRTKSFLICITYLYLKCFIITALIINNCKEAGFLLFIN